MMGDFSVTPIHYVGRMANVTPYRFSGSSSASLRLCACAVFHPSSLFSLLPSPLFVLGVLGVLADQSISPTVRGPAMRLADGRGRSAWFRAARPGHVRPRRGRGSRRAGGRGG